MTESRTVSVSIARSPDAVYAYLADPANFPQWSAFISEVKPDRESWLAKTPRGSMHLRFTPRNPFRILDHDVVTHNGTIIHVPLRVVPNGPAASEVLFTIFRQPDMSLPEFEQDIAIVQTDLDSLKTLLNTKPQ